MPKASGLDPAIVEAFSDHHDRLGQIGLIDSAATDKAVATALEAAGRLLAFESWHDQLEERKRKIGTLPPKVEKAAVEGFIRAESDARELAASAIDAVRTFSNADFFDQAVPYLCEGVQRAGGKIDVSHLFAASRNP